MSESTTEPAVPPDGACVGCGRERRFAGRKPVYLESAKADPFCSTACARRWYGVALPAAAPKERRAYVSALPKSG